MWQLIQLYLKNVTFHESHSLLHIVGTHLQASKTQNTPEMNVSEHDKNILKIWAHNFKK